jgi:hypothetical protein
MVSTAMPPTGDDEFQRRLFGITAAFECCGGGFVAADCGRKGIGGNQEAARFVRLEGCGEADLQPLVQIGDCQDKSRGIDGGKHMGQDGQLEPLESDAHEQLAGVPERADRNGDVHGLVVIISVGGMGGAAPSAFGFDVRVDADDDRQTVDSGVGGLVPFGASDGERLSGGGRSRRMQRDFDVQDVVLDGGLHGIVSF